MNETTFRPFDMQRGKTVRYTSEPQRIIVVVEGFRADSNHAISNSFVRE
jgi:hypothetical protein